MFLRNYIPHAALRDHISSIAIMHLQLEKGKEPAICPFPPAPQHCIIFYVDDKVETQKLGEQEFKTYPRSIIVGPQVTSVNIRVKHSHKAVMIAFHPGGLFRLLGVPLQEFFDDGFSASEIIGAEVNEVTEQLREASSYYELKIIVENYLLRKLHSLPSPLPFDYAIKELIKNDGNVSIDKIASLSCLSLRQFERKCHERIGMPPRFFARIARFSKAYRLRESQPSLNWTAIAHQSGYYDQMHFIRDFKKFAGVTPTMMEHVLERTPFRMQEQLML
jgi:AraC-like DNA-binding protein